MPYGYVPGEDSVGCLPGTGFIARLDCSQHGGAKSQGMQLALYKTWVPKRTCFRGEADHHLFFARYTFTSTSLPPAPLLTTTACKPLTLVRPSGRQRFGLVRLDLTRIVAVSQWRHRSEVTTPQASDAFPDYPRVSRVTNARVMASCTEIAVSKSRRLPCCAPRVGQLSLVPIHVSRSERASSPAFPLRTGELVRSGKGQRDWLWP